MGKYRVIYCLQLTHTYYKDQLCRGIDISVNPASVELIRRRGLIFKKTNVNEWCLIGDENIGIENLESDVFLFDMHLQDANFLNFTKWDGFNPASLYSLYVPIFPLNTIMNFISKVKVVVDRKKDNGFCVMKLEFKDTLHTDLTEIITNCFEFQASAAYFEYFFIPRDKSQYDIVNLDLISEDNTEVIEFTVAKQDGGWRFISKEPMPISECYDYHLSLIDTNTKVKLMKFVPYKALSGLLEPKEDSDFLQEMEPDPKILRQICYF